jgi:hypothetical protein
MVSTGIAIFVTVFFLATLVEFLIERFLGESISGKKMKYVAGLVGMALGVAACFGLKVAALHAAGLVAEDVDLWADYLVTGLIVGGGSSAVHKFFDKYLPESTGTNKPTG